jgi:hypothetical protein
MRTRRGLPAYPEYVRFWLADTVSMVGTHVTTLAKHLAVGLAAGLCLPGRRGCVRSSRDAVA